MLTLTVLSIEDLLFTIFKRTKKPITAGHLMTQYALLLLFHTENQFFNYRLMVHSN